MATQPALPDKLTLMSIPFEDRREILERMLFENSAMSDSVDIPAIDLLRLSQKTTWRAHMQILLTCKQLLEEGSQTFYECNYFRVSPISIAQGQALAESRANPIEIIKRMWLVQDIIPDDANTFWLPSQTKSWVPRLFIDAPEARPDILYIGCIFPGLALLRRHDVFQFVVQLPEHKYGEDFDGFHLYHPTLGIVARVIVSEESRIPSKEFEQAIEDRDSQTVEMYLEFAREHSMKQNALNLVEALEEDGVDRHDLIRHIYECVSPAGFGLMVTTAQKNNVHIPADCSHLARPQPVSPPDYLALCILANRFSRFLDFKLTQ
jgi:hypothetical protein